MNKTIVSNPRNDSLIEQLGALYLTLKNHKEEEFLSFDFTRVKFASPFLILPLSTYINSTSSPYESNEAIQSYLEAVKFPKGISSVSSFQKEIQRRKNYIPISVLEKESGSNRERLESIFSNLISKTIGSVPGTSNAILYPINELATNIFEHSQQSKGYLFGQFYPKKNYLDICIVDRGRGLAASYEENLGLNISDSEAISRVMKGNSTKLSKERGYGVRTSKCVVCEAMKGEFVILSGSSALVSSQKSEKLVALPDFYWQGVIIAYRIPKPIGPVDIYTDGCLE